MLCTLCFVHVQIVLYENSLYAKTIEMMELCRKEHTVKAFNNYMC